MFASPLFTPIDFSGRNLAPQDLEGRGCSAYACQHGHNIPLGQHTLWGIPFHCDESAVYVNSDTHLLTFSPFTARQIIFFHTAEAEDPVPGADGIYRYFRGLPSFMEPVCDYILTYADGSTVTIPIRIRMELSTIQPGHRPMLAKPTLRGYAIMGDTERNQKGEKVHVPWYKSQLHMQGESSDGPLHKWVFAFENPKPDVAVTGMEIVKKNGNLFLFGITAGDVASNPLRYGRREKAVLSLSGDPGEPLSLADIDMGNIISVFPQTPYDNAGWEGSSFYSLPDKSEGRYVVEYTAHEEAILYLGEDRTPLPVSKLMKDPELTVSPAERPVSLKVCDSAGKAVPVRVHAHGTAGEYLPPLNRHRIPNLIWFEDLSLDHARKNNHFSSYIDGTAEYQLPLGEVYFEVYKGFEVNPVRRTVTVGPDTDEIVITLDRIVDWRSKGWVTADTHVHFLSPNTALLEGEAEDVHVVNLLAAQWGELFTNIVDYKDNGETMTPNGEYMVRVGSENRQGMLGHINLLGYNGGLITPLSSDGIDEAAFGDPLEVTITQWAAQCRARGGLSVIAHFPHPRCDQAAAIVSDLIDGVEITKLGTKGIDPYYLSDWYRYLNCGYQVAAVGGTDKMSTRIAIGDMRTYAKLDGPFTHQTWIDAVKAGRTFATMGALVDMHVEDCHMGGKIKLSKGRSLTVSWDLASVLIPVTSLELVMNGETVDGIRFDGLLGERSGYFNVHVPESAWLALRVRGKVEEYDGIEVVVAHTSTVFVIVGEKPIFNGPDAASILEQIEGAAAYVSVMATRAQESQFKLALATLAGAHRLLHNRMHDAGHFHNHSPEDQHPGH